MWEWDGSRGRHAGRHGDEQAALSEPRHDADEDNPRDVRGERDVRPAAGDQRQPAHPLWRPAGAVLSHRRALRSARCRRPAAIAKQPSGLSAVSDAGVRWAATSGGQWGRVWRGSQGRTIDGRQWRWLRGTSKARVRMRSGKRKQQQHGVCVGRRGQRWQSVISRWQHRAGSSAVQHHVYKRGRLQPAEAGCEACRLRKLHSDGLQPRAADRGESCEWRPSGGQWGMCAARTDGQSAGGREKRATWHVAAEDDCTAAGVGGGTGAVQHRRRAGGLQRGRRGWGHAEEEVPVHVVRHLPISQVLPEEPHQRRAHEGARLPLRGL